jgi:hypothetical protein
MCTTLTCSSTPFHVHVHNANVLQHHTLHTAQTRIADLEQRLTEELKRSADLARLNKKYALEVRHQDRTMHTLVKGDTNLPRTLPLPMVGGKATGKKHAPRGSGLPK